MALLWWSFHLPFLAPPPEGLMQICFLMRGWRRSLRILRMNPSWRRGFFYSDEDSDGGGQETKAMGMCLLFLANFLFLFFPSFPDISLWLLYISFFFFVATDILEEPKIAVGLATPIALASTIPVALTPMGPGNFLLIMLSSCERSCSLEGCSQKRDLGA